jgi:hypothetical protein
VLIFRNETRSSARFETVVVNDVGFGETWGEIELSFDTTVDIVSVGDGHDDEVVGVSVSRDEVADVIEDCVDIIDGVVVRGVVVVVVVVVGGGGGGDMLLSPTRADSCC